MKVDPKKILICIDTSAHSYKVADKGILFARKLNAQISLLHVVDTRQIKRDLAEKMLEKKVNRARKFTAKLLYTFSCAALVHIECGHPAEIILEKAEKLEADVIIMGNRMKKRASTKSVVNEVVKRAERSILTI